ncbi:hypothetical protein RFI_13947 [Reticulomyxa filosa]|uniref:Uncharacterized protein n=1 Tax=Reticulomyxa filosa TaxID=46433 RepID=X6ND30_RETFI|nr:hypothetical protein RFI_13947 [Reticulomyxa filosa]|eukprot:ETO23237.1 hypothetical protein RFI_13947 [Reticulomyxa filosa]
MVVFMEKEYTQTNEQHHHLAKSESGGSKDIQAKPRKRKREEDVIELDGDMDDMSHKKKMKVSKDQPQHIEMGSIPSLHSSSHSLTDTVASSSSHTASCLLEELTDNEERLLHNNCLHFLYLYLKDIKHVVIHDGTYDKLLQILFSQFKRCIAFISPFIEIEHTKKKQKTITINKFRCAMEDENLAIWTLLVLSELCKHNGSSASCNDGWTSNLSCLLFDGIWSKDVMFLTYLCHLLAEMIKFKKISQLGHLQSIFVKSSFFKKIFFFGL